MIPQNRSSYAAFSIKNNFWSKYFIIFIRWFLNNVLSILRAIAKCHVKELLSFILTLLFTFTLLFLGLFFFVHLTIFFLSLFFTTVWTIFSRLLLLLWRMVVLGVYNLCCFFSDRPDKVLFSNYNINLTFVHLLNLFAFILQIWSFQDSYLINSNYSDLHEVTGCCYPCFTLSIIVRLLFLIVTHAFEQFYWYFPIFY